MRDQSPPKARSLVHHQRWIVIEVVRQLLPEPIADPPPKVHEGLTSFDVDVCFLGQKVCHHLDVDPTPWPDLIDTRSCSPDQGRGFLQLRQIDPRWRLGSRPGTGLIAFQLKCSTSGCEHFVG